MEPPKKPGRAIDESVALKLMGWETKEVSPDSISGLDRSVDVPIGADSVIGWRHPDYKMCQQGYWFLNVPYYSTFIEAAMQVVEKLKTHPSPKLRHPGIVMHWWGLEQEWEVYWEVDDGIFTDKATAPTLPHAICLAALEVCDNV